MPNDKLAGGIVVASVYYTDEIALVLILNPSAPFFKVIHYFMDDVEGFGGPAMKAGDTWLIATAENIVPAVRVYEENGGDY